MNENDIAISVSNVSKAFKLPHEKHASIKSLFVNVFRGRRTYEKQQVLKNISFEIKKGEFFGIVGRNGSGKSTLLKLLAGIYSPDKGAIQINGKLVPFIELGVGFNPELTGRENVYLNGALLGFNTKEVDEMYKDIVGFAELEKFMDQKLKNYSSGMQVRLAFSIAIRAKADVLVLDEVLAVGDEAFQRKCYEYFADLKRAKKTVILVTHSMDAVRKYCSSAMIISKGKIVNIGDPEDIANEYSMENLQGRIAGLWEQKENALISNFKIELLSPGQVNQDEEIEIRVKYKVKKKVSTKVGVSFYDIDRNAPIFGSVSPLTNGVYFSMVLKVRLPYINNSTIRIDTTVRNNDNEFLFYTPQNESPIFMFKRDDYRSRSISKYALLFDQGEWS